MNPVWLIPAGIIGGIAGYVAGVLQENWRPGVPHPEPGDHRPPRTARLPGGPEPVSPPSARGQGIDPLQSARNEQDRNQLG